MASDSYNIGEWSELYAFYKLLGEGKIYAADSELKKIEDVYFPIMKILREECGESLEYLANETIKIISASTGEIIREISVDEFVAQARIILEKMLFHESRSGSFRIPGIQVFREKSKTNNFKSSAREKSDIKIVVHDMHTGLQPILGFSIKSRLGSPSTLFNPGKATNIIYEISPDMSSEDMSEINAIEGSKKLKNRLLAIKEKGYEIKYRDMEGEKLQLNLQLIDSSLPRITAEMLLAYYNGEVESPYLSDIVAYIESVNPCRFDYSFNHKFYDYKIRNMLTDMALGMVPGKIWDGRYHATGGYIVVREDGELVCYHIYKRAEFQDYLLNNTKFETPSTSRYGFGFVYKLNNETFIKLNMQIRFKK